MLLFENKRQTDGSVNRPKRRIFPGEHNYAHENPEFLYFD
jgi:hypothetical protein